MALFLVVFPVFSSLVRMASRVSENTVCTVNVTPRNMKMPSETLSEPDSIFGSFV